MLWINQVIIGSQSIWRSHSRTVVGAQMYDNDNWKFNKPLYISKLLLVLIIKNTHSLREGGN